MTLMIEAHDISKRYMRNMSAQPRYKTLRDGLTNAAKRLVGGGKPRTEPDLREFWALKDVSFSISQGEVVGIIGRNGAGKSTLLKVLSRITAPTSGEARLHGRVGSLLEVGTGFHPELTGRENIFMNGVILGMGRKEILRKFDEIVAFSGVADFIDTPVKWYSSGMYMRLAFSVAAHLEPEILIVDEVLAVGDADFQKKCLGKMKNVSQEGRTVIFVSHNTNAIQQLCSRVLWMDKGHIVQDTTDVHGVAGNYLFGNEDTPHRSSWLKGRDGSFSNDHFELNVFRLYDEDGHDLPAAIPNFRSARLEIDITLTAVDPLLRFGYAVYDENGTCVYWSTITDTPEKSWPQLTVGRNRLVTAIPARFLNEGRYRIDFFACLHNVKTLSEPERTPVSVTLQIQGGLSDSPYWIDYRHGTVAPVLEWSKADS